MKIKSYKNIYTHCAVNIGYHLLDLCGNILCYGSSSSIVLFSLEDKKVLNVFHGHSDEVNSVRFFRNDRKYIASSSVDKTVIIWSKISQNEYEILQKIDFKSSVSIADAIEYDDKIYVFAATRDKSFKIWTNSEIILEESSKNFIFDIKAYKNLKLFPGLTILLACSDGKIYFKIFDFETKKFQTLTSFSGHTDWIRTIDLHQSETNGTIFIASGAQDFSARVFSIFELIQEDNQDKVLHKPTFKYDKKEFMTECVTILYTHDLWVNSVKWFTKDDDSLCLLTASSDRTIILWQEVETIGELSSSKVWQEMARFGEFGGVQMGFNGCVLDWNANLVIGYNYLGAIEIWRQGETIYDWEQTMSVSGHFGNVTDLIWEPKGEYFLTCSEDRTTRLHSKYKNGNSWHEIARPQVHGHALKTIALAGPVKLISGAEEKVIRIFNATKYFIQSLKNISDIDLMQNRGLNDSDMAEYATIPALGLSNSAVYQSDSTNEAQKIKMDGDDGKKDDENGENIVETKQEESFIPKILENPPIEEALEQNTLWPEIQKLYGHGFELFSMAVNSTGTLLASACRAQSVKHAMIIVWNLNNYEILLKLGAHNLTITQLKFSPDDRFLLSVSRDRTWNLFNMEQNNDKFQFGERIAFFNSKTGGHNRIIWDCAWIQDSKSFLTVARDQKAILWNILDDLNVQSNSNILTLEHPITSVDVLTSTLSNSNHFISSFGLENGKILLYEFNQNNGWTLLSELKQFWHTSTINRIRFSSKVEENSDFNIQKALLASCGVDKMVKLIEILFEN